MKDFITENFNWSVDGLRKCIADNKLDAKIIAINGNKAIVKVNNYEASVCLGSYSNWCISQHKCSWEQYVSNHPNNIQLFFFDFSLHHKKHLSLVGATFTMDESLESMKLMCCFTRENHPIGEKIGKGPESDLEALNKLIAVPHFGLEITTNNNPLFESLVKDFEREVMPSNSTLSEDFITLKDSTPKMVFEPRAVRFTPPSFSYYDDLFYSDNF